MVQRSTKSGSRKKRGHAKPRKTLSAKRPILLIHGGAGHLLKTPAMNERARKSLLAIVNEGFDLLCKGQSAPEVVALCVRRLEDDPQFNAGTGGKLQSDGMARLTAAMMDSRSLLFSGVINVEQIKNPILIARKLQGEKDRVLAGPGAQTYGIDMGLPKENPITEAAFSEWKRRSLKRKKKTEDEEALSLVGTVGAVALDLKGELAAATSTGGKGMEIVGRVSDSATVAGTYVSRKAAVSATGVGEEIMDAALAARIVTRVDDGSSLKQAFAKTFQELKARGRRAGAIGVDSRGTFMVDKTTPCILYAVRTPRQTFGYPTENS